MRLLIGRVKLVAMETHHFYFCVGMPACVIRASAKCGLNAPTERVKNGGNTRYLSTFIGILVWWVLGLK